MILFSTLIPNPWALLSFPLSGQRRHSNMKRTGGKPQQPAPSQMMPQPPPPPPGMPPPGYQPPAGLGMPMGMPGMPVAMTGQMIPVAMPGQMMVALQPYGGSTGPIQAPYGGSAGPMPVTYINTGVQPFPGSQGPMPAPFHGSSGPMQVPYGGSSGPMMAPMMGSAGPMQGPILLGSSAGPMPSNMVYGRPFHGSAGPAPAKTLMAFGGSSGPMRPPGVFSLGIQGGPRKGSPSPPAPPPAHSLASRRSLVFSSSLLLASYRSHLLGSSASGCRAVLQGGPSPAVLRRDGSRQHVGCLHGRRQAWRHP